MLAVRGHLRLVHRLLGRAGAADQVAVPGRESHRLCLPRAAGWRADASGGRLDFRQARRCARHAVDLRRHDRGGVRRAGGVAARRRRRQLRLLPRGLYRAVRADRHRQRLDLPHDPGDLPDRAPARRQGPGRRRATPGAAGCRQGIRRGAGLLRRDRRLWRLLHPQELRHLAGADRRARRRAVLLCRLLCQLRAGDVVVLRAPQRPHALLNRLAGRPSSSELGPRRPPPPIAIRRQFHQRIGRRPAPP
ncbi:hypothetical protein CBM2587_B90427 [Cupriavidus taiwanensis]|uniref:Uncharacterized protein n=1 Tax=Cupriavidus taiwanensis TaxID=164546 RepID=A0A975XEJ6_9BURK|nr:hypothetical protein CBM2587_B90427 [Cupriavidus taiwanensis]